VKKEDIPKVAEEKVKALEKSFNFEKLKLKDNAQFKELIRDESTNESRDKIVAEAISEREKA
jgi:hypothetical protein